MQRIDGYPDFIKDDSNGAILNTNKEALAAYKKTKKRMKKVEDLEQEVFDLREKVDQMHTMLASIYERVSK